MSNPTLSLTESSLDKLSVEVIIFGIVQGDSGPQLAPGSEPIARYADSLDDVLTAMGATGKAEEVTRIPAGRGFHANSLLAVGLGEPGAEGVSAEAMRRASGSAARALIGTQSAATTLSALDLSATVQGTVLGAYAFQEYKSKAGDAPLSTVELAVSEIDDAARSSLKGANAIAEAVNTARDLVNTPPNALYPAVFAERAADLAKSAGLEVDVLDEADLRKHGYGGVLGVGGGSVRAPRLVRLRYSGTKPSAKVALVGKGITFDTGGISLKPAAGMNDMTSDMGGAAAVIATMVLAAKLHYPLEITATVPMAENMPSGTAYRPGDVLRMYNGTTVEVLNTDAEGRLILADAISRACADEPDYLIETSTLTGAQTVALGNRTPGVMGSAEFRDRVAHTSRSIGENSWAMPLPEELRGELESQVADLTNVTGQRWGGMLVAGHFLKEFMSDDVQWAHIDVAGPAYNTTAPWGYTPKGGTGVPVRTLAAALGDIASQG